VISNHPTATRAARILIVDDDAGQRSLLNSFLQSQGFDTVLAESGERALELLRAQPFSMMISDVRMPGISGLEALRRVRKEHAVLPVLLVTAYADIREAVGAMRDGAVNYLAKPIDLDELLRSVRHAVGLVSEESVRFAEDKELPAHIIARSPTMQALFRDASLIASSDCRILITGESGVGKEILADVIHAWSPRAAGPIVKVNCAAIPETLLESELFGHEKGAFTGAVAQRVGRFEVASGGTMFLDEIGEMSPKLQAKLLQVTQDGCFQRIGSNTEIRTNARILASTNRNLEEEVKAGHFREDLYYRLNVVELNIPPLRERPEDILPLAHLFIGQFTQGRSRLSSSVADCLSRKNGFNRTETAKALGISRRTLVYKLQRLRALGYEVDWH
jgi:DNA-binding NtrC family response regulator